MFSVYCTQFTFFAYKQLLLTTVMKRLVVLFFVILSLSSCFFKKSASKVHTIKNKSFNQVFKNTDNEYRYKIAEQYYANQKYAYALQLFEDLFAYVKGTDKYEDMYYNCLLYTSRCV